EPTPDHTAGNRPPSARARAQATRVPVPGPVDRPGDTPSMADNPPCGPVLHGRAPTPGSPASQSVITVVVEGANVSLPVRDGRRRNAAFRSDGIGTNRRSGADLVGRSLPPVRRLRSPQGRRATMRTTMTTLFSPDDIPEDTVLQCPYPLKVCPHYGEIWQEW